MSENDFSRRLFLQQASVVLAGLGISASWPQFVRAASDASLALDTEDVLRVLTPGQAKDLGVLADTIYPATDTPGATEIGVVWFMDRAFDGFMGGALPLITGEIKAINQSVGAAASGSGLAELPQAKLDSILQDRLQSPFFSVLQLLTLAGVFAMPAHGGNRRHEGWKQIGFDHRHAWVPPFGYYDAGHDDAGAES